MGNDTKKGYEEVNEEDHLLDNHGVSGGYEMIKPPSPAAWGKLERKINAKTQDNKQQTDTDKENSSPQQEPSRKPPTYEQNESEAQLRDRINVKSQSHGDGDVFLDSTNRRQPHAPQCRPHVDHEAKEKAKTLRQAETENVLQLLSLAKVAELQAEEPQAQTEENDFELAKRLQAEELEQESLRLAQQLAGNFSQEYRRLTEASSLPECSSVPLLLIMMIVPIFFVLYLIFAKRFRGAAKPRRSTQADGALPTWNAVSVKDRE